MNSPDIFNFEVVSIADANDALEYLNPGHGEITEKQRAAAALKAQMAAQRLPNPPVVVLDDAVYLWMTQIPEAARPIVLAQQYPRILNKIVNLWLRPLKCDDYLETLIMDTRGDRSGFPHDITVELAQLKIYFDANVSHPVVSVWGDRLGDDLTQFRK